MVCVCVCIWVVGGVLLLLSSVEMITEYQSGDVSSGKWGERILS